VYIIMRGNILLYPKTILVLYNSMMVRGKRPFYSIFFL
jgi:hypothetical protein